MASMNIFELFPGQIREKNFILFHVCTSKNKELFTVVVSEDVDNYKRQIQVEKLKN